MPQFYSQAATDAGVAANCDPFTRAYIEAIYFTDTGDSEQPDSETPLHDSALASIIEDCADFQRGNAILLARAYARTGYTPAQAGHDLWLTRNRHGAGFWDRGQLQKDGLGRALTEFAHAYGERYVTESDGFLYVE